MNLQTSELQMLLDRMAIQDVLVAYCHAVDTRDWTTFSKLFTAEATLDFSAFGGPVCGVPAMVEFLEGVLGSMRPGQHTISTSQVEINADHATARTAAHVTMGSRLEEAPGITQVGLWYRDTLVRTSQGWRIASRTQEYGWVRS